MVSSDGISPWTPLNPEHRSPCWRLVQWEPSACRSFQCCQKRDHQKFESGFALSDLLGSGRASMNPLGTLSFGLWVILVDPALIAGYQSSKTVGSELISSTISLPSWQCLSFWSSLSTLGTNFAQILRIFSFSRIIVCTFPTLASHCAFIVSIDTRRSLSMKFLIWPINSCVLASLLFPHISTSLTVSLPSLNLLCH